MSNVQLNDLTFITSLQIESVDRLRNAITVFSFLSKKFPESKILIKELDVESKFEKYALPKIKEMSGAENIRHIFQKHDGLFNKSQLINDLALESHTNIIFNYDVDMIFPTETYYKAYHMLCNDGYDVVYPYGCGVYQWKVLNFDEQVTNFINSGYDPKTLIPFSERGGSVMGFGQMMKKKSFLSGYGLNENFIFVGYEDTEFLYRMGVLGYKIGRINDDAYHIEHIRIKNNSYSDKEFYEKNILLWEWMRKQDKKTIQNYYQSQDYIKKFK